MKKILWGVALGALLAGAWANIGIACGDKFLVMNRSLSKAQCFGMAKPGSILIYQNSNSAAIKQALGDDLERTLSAVGHRVRVVDSPEAFASAIKDGSFDLILSGYSSAEEVQKTLQEAGKKAKFVPVVDKENKAEMKSAKERYGNVIKNTDRTSTKVLMINEVMLAKDKKSDSGI